MKLRSELYDTMGQFGGFGLMDMLASFALFDDDPARVNTLEDKFEQVTPELIQKTAKEYLRPDNRTGDRIATEPKGRSGNQRRNRESEMSRTILKTGLAGGWVGVCAASPRDGPRSRAPPEGGPAKAFNVPAHETYTLPNGMRVTLVPYGFPKVTVDITIVAGSADEGKDHQGVAGLTAELLKEGTEKLTAPSWPMKRRAWAARSALNSSYDRTDAGLDVLSEFGPDAVRLLADVVMHPRLPESELDRHKNDQAAPDRVGVFAAADHRHDALPQDPLWRSSVQRRSAFGGRRKENRHPGREELCRGEFQSRSRPHLCRRQIRPARGEEGHRRQPGYVEGVRGSAHHAGAQAQSAARAGSGGPAGRAAIDHHDRIAGGHGRQPGCHSAAGDQCAAGRLVQLAHHGEYPGTEGLHVFAVRHHLEPLSRFVLGGAGRRDHQVHRARR